MTYIEHTFDTTHTSGCDHLESACWVRRLPNDDDRRRIIIAPTVFALALVMGLVPVGFANGPHDNGELTPIAYGLVAVGFMS